MSVIVPVLGTPSALTSWALHCVLQLMRTAFGDVLFAPVSTRSDLAKAWDDRNNRPVLILATNPSRDLADLLLRTPTRGLVCWESPLTVADFVAHARQYDPVLTVRFVSQCLATLEPFQADRARNAPLSMLRLTPEVLAHNAHDTVVRIAQFCLSDLMGVRWDVWCEQLAIPAGASVQDHMHALVPQAKAATHAARENTRPLWVTSCLEDYQPLSQGHGVQTVTWPMEVFPDWGRPAHMLSGPLSLLGPARILTSGHAMHLPAGSWQADVVCSIVANESQNAFALRVFEGDTCLVETAFVPPVRGDCVHSVTLTTHDPAMPLQVQLVLTQGAIAGELTFQHVTFHRRADG